MFIVNKIKKLDMLILLITFALGLVGTMAIYEATVGTNLHNLHIQNFIMLILFCAPMLCIALIDYRIIVSKLAYGFYGIGVALLVAVHFFGENKNGAQRWLNLGGFEFQPSELAKICTILLVAHLLHRRKGEQLKIGKDIIPILLVFLVPVLFIYKQPDLGTALVFLGMMLSMLWMGNVRMIYMALCVGLGAAAIVAVFWLFHNNYDLLASIVKSHQMDRIQTFIDPASDPDKSWHVNNALIAIGSGGLNGDSGYFFQKGFIPYVYSDSIFVAVGEKYGFIGSSVLLFLFFLLLYRMIIVSNESRDLAGSYIVIGIIGMLVFQIFVNIGMHVGIMPLTGISLPFISYGGSTMLTNMIAIGIVLSVAVHKNEIVID
ncbi:FtsW/RodA/SpoVE family cell cycle protein [Paenibacillus sp. IITD108]|uniref:FtsW/RodA/SpoVE family cell cycle protein n=1 Tax=Paenibacillus sp. IITD108 TaxID=3116649 RepID=UPI002F3E313A